MSETRSTDDIVNEMDIVVDENCDFNSTIGGTFQEVHIGQSVMPRVRKIDASTTQNSTKSFTCHCPIFLPFGKFIFYWNLFLCVILMYSIIEIPFELAFQIKLYAADFFAILGFCIDLCLLFDIFLNFRTAYIDKYDRLRIIADPKLIAKRYLKTWFIIDFLASTPFTYIILIFSGQHTADDSIATTETFQFLRLLRILKLLRIIKILKMFHHFRERSFHIPNMDDRRTRTLINLIRIVMIMLLIAHYFACFWYGIGLWTDQQGEPSWIDTIEQNNHGDSHNFIKYSYAFYWAIVTLFTTGYGDIVAHNVYEQWTCSLGILIGSTCSAYFIGVLTTGLGDDLRHQSKRDTVERCLSFCSHYDLPKELRRAVLTHMRYFNDYNYLFDHQLTMQALPNHLQKHIEIYLATSVLKELDIFESLPPSIVGQIALRLKAKSVGAEQLLYEKGEIGRELYIQRTGKSKLLYQGLPNRYRMLERGDVVGENAILSRTRNNTVLCLMWSEFYVLDINDIASVLKDNYDAVTAKSEWNKIKKTIRDTISESSYFRDSQLAFDEKHEYVPHRHVRFKTLDMSKFDTYVDPQYTLSPKKTKSDSFDDIDKRSYSEYEHKLELEDEIQSMEHQKSVDTKKKVSFKALTKIFMDGQGSDSRNTQQRKHYTKLQKDKTLQYTHVPLDELVFVEAPNGLDNNDNIFDEEMEPIKSAGFFKSKSHDILNSINSKISSKNSNVDDQKIEEEATLQLMKVRRTKSDKQEAMDVELTKLIKSGSSFDDSENNKNNDETNHPQQNDMKHHQHSMKIT